MKIGPITTRRGDLEIVVDPIDVEPGQRLVVFGPNGAGKTTLLRAIAGDRAERIAYLPQRPYLFRGTGRTNLMLGVSDAERATQLANRLGVGNQLDVSARSLSGGERHRIALARTLATDARLVLLDEPTAPIDRRDRATILSTIVEATEHRSAVIVTHDQEVAVALASELAVMIDGSIRQSGDPSEVFTLPADDDVAAVVGVANAVSGIVSSVNDGLVTIDAEGVEIAGVGSGLEPGDAARALFGAETVTVFTDFDAPSGSARNRWAGTITSVRPVGILVEVVVEDRFAAVITPGSMEAMSLEVGAVVTLAVKAAAVRVVAAP
ncbi:MAG: ABC transporter ATP-binding protein [Acidimicrobiia bacterium]|nr:ABC transporter ATP-binding protein [Acidimicrobiia bacterium]